MARLHLRHDPGTAAGQKTLVWVGDSITKSDAGDTDTTNWDRAGDLVARSLCTRGVIRYAAGYIEDETGHNHTWTRSGGVSTTHNLALKSPTTNTPAESLAYAASIASTHDLIYHQVCTGGSTAGSITYPTSGWDTYGEGVAEVGGTNPEWDTIDANGSFADHVDWLVVEFAYNDIQANDTPSMYEANLTARLSEWTNVGRKFLALSWVSDGGGGRTYPNDAISRSAYYDAAVNAAGAVTAGGGAGHLQSTIPVLNMGWSGQGLQAYPGSVTTLAYDGTHLTQSGARTYLARWGRWAELGVMRP